MFFQTLPDKQFYLWTLSLLVLFALSVSILYNILEPVSIRLNTVLGVLGYVKTSCTF